MSDVYQLVSVAGVKEDSSAITKVLQEIRNKKLPNDLRLLNYYNEIPVSYPAQIEHVEEEMVDLTVHQQQAVVMVTDRMTFLTSKHFPFDVVAKVFRVDTHRCLAILTHFAYAHVRAQRREFVRVQVPGRVDVTFVSAEGSLSGRLYDISLGGLSFISQIKKNIDVNTKGTLSVGLQSRTFDIPAVLLKTVPDERNFKYIFEIDVSGKIENHISQFIFQRQLEIIRELKESA